MTNELFLTPCFTNEMLTAGATLIEQLDKTEAQLVAAFWTLDAAESHWELTLVSPLIGREGPRSYYQRINDLNALVDLNEQTISLHDIRVSNTHHRLVQAISQSAIDMRPLINKRLGKYRMDDVFMEDLYIYRMNFAY